MNPQCPRKDLIVLSADKSMKLVIDELLARHSHLEFRRASADVLAHPENDPGVLNRCHDFLRNYARQYHHAIAICDRHGSGQESRSRPELEDRMENNLRANGWDDDRAAAIVIDPELENWMWGDWRATSECLNWHGPLALRAWLIQEELLAPEASKPPEPKKALKSAAKRAGKGWSSSIHQAIAFTAQCDRCTDPAFLKLRSTLQRWFSAAEPT